MEKKKYSKPVVVAERFEPQEYCEVCARSGHEYRPNESQMYFDFSDDGICQSTNEYVSSTGSTSYLNGRYTVKTYQYQGNFFGWHAAVFGNPDGRRYGSTWDLIYRLESQGTVRVVVKDGQVYKNQS